MRIITGSAKGSKLSAPKGLEVRPTIDRVKESVFNILGSAVIDAKVLDLFAGTGNLSLEALSRGATEAVLVENSPASLEAIRKNAEHTHFTAQIKIYRLDVLKALPKLIRSNEQFDLVFMDPPYDRGFVASVLAFFAPGTILKANGMLVVEHSRHEKVEESGLQQLKLLRTERYGRTTISFLTVEV